MRSARRQIAVVHADESCLGNGRDGQTPGGAASLIEIAQGHDVVRRDLYISAPDTTNNRMALAGAIATLALLSRKGRRLRVAYVSDSEYLVKGMNEWVPGWKRRGWKRKTGAIENLELWQALVQVAAAHEVRWHWVRGHAGHAKNEYVNDLAMRAAREQLMSAGAVASGFPDWLAAKRERQRYTDYDPDAAFRDVAAGFEGEG
jgi:ribonuclease HI